MASFLGAEPLIKTRLESKLQQPTRVLSITEIDKIEDLKQLAPAVYISYDGYSDINKSGTGQAQILTQRWGVTVAVRGVRDYTSGVNVRDVAGSILDEVLTALLGFKLSPDYAYFKLIETSGAFYEGGFAFFPLTFETQLTVVGDTT